MSEIENKVMPVKLIFPLPSKSKNYRKYLKLQIQGLEASIEHWKENLERAKEGKIEEIKTGPHSCALCQLYTSFINKAVTALDTCTDCPVMEKTGLDGCEGTPYNEVDDAISFYEEGKDKVIVEAVEKELSFLVSLLEDKKKELEHA